MLVVLLMGVFATCPCRDEYDTFRKRFERRDGRCETFCHNLQLINDHNNHPNASYQVEVRALHDMTDEERYSELALGGFRAPFHGVLPVGVTLATMTTFGPVWSQSVNWFVKDRVTNVRNQNRCGDCWAESAAVLLESMWYQTTGKLEQVSVQQLAECPPPPEHNQGCGGGWPLDALRYAKNNTGVCLESSYPTVIGDGNDRNCNTTLVRNCTVPLGEYDIYALARGDEVNLLRAANNDVVSVAIDASGAGFYGFKSGIYDGLYNGTSECSPTSLDHAVAVIGFDSDDGVPFYIVRNSWGPEYGMSGYIMMKRGIDVCGIAQQAVTLLRRS